MGNLNRYGGSYGVILDNDGNAYVFSGQHFFRNGSYPKHGAKVSFSTIAYGSYATDIDVLEKSK